LDARADIYALGTIAYNMLGGRTPFSGDYAQLIAQKLLQNPPPLNTLRSDIPAPVEQAVMHALKKSPAERPASVADWFGEFERAAGASEEMDDVIEPRLVIMGPTGSDVYVDDERHGSIGRSGKIILTSIPPGRHVLRVARSADEDDERVIELREEGDEQIIQAQFTSTPSSGLSPSQGGSLGSVSGAPSSLPGVVACTRCGARFAAGVRFCGRCGSAAFQPIMPDQAMTGFSHPDYSPGSSQRVPPGPGSQSGPGSVSPAGPAVTCTRCGAQQLAGVKFCGRCGASLGGSVIAWDKPRPVELVCSTCRVSYPAGTKFCGRCGRVLKA
jgi:serine/threonine protein kinase